MTTMIAVKEKPSRYGVLLKTKNNNNNNILWEICCQSCQITFSTHFFNDKLSHFFLYWNIARDQQHHHHLHHYHADTDVLLSFFSYKEKSQTKAANTSTPSLYDNDKDVPIFECGRQQRCTVREAMRILPSEHQQEMKCSKTPLKARQNLSFLINVAKVKNWQEVKNDMNDVFATRCELVRGR